MNFASKKVLIIGMGKSGIAAALVLVKKGAVVTACDIKMPESMQETIDHLMRHKVEVMVGSYPKVKKEKYDLVVISPGVPLTIEPIQSAYNLNIPILGELELAYQLKKLDLQMYAITGTNGKTTTTMLLQHILTIDGVNCVAGGNIGTPLTMLVDKMDTGVICVEASSFQLETTSTFRPYISSVLNITPDHLDRHKNMEAYIKAKTRIFENQSHNDFTILNYDDPIVRDFAALSKAQIIYFSTNQVLSEGVFISEGVIMAHMKNTLTEICNVDEVSLRGKHNLENMLCATAIALVAGANPQHIESALKSFEGVQHRMEEVRNHEGIIYINDSKATNPESAIKAIESFNQPIILIAGGRNKGSKFDDFAQVLIEKSKALILLGESKEEIKSAVMARDYTNIHEVDNLDQAVKLAYQLAEKGDVVLLSPACASWDMFDSYEQRGDIFCELVDSVCGV